MLNFTNMKNLKEFYGFAMLKNQVLKGLIPPIEMQEICKKILPDRF